MLWVFVRSSFYIFVTHKKSYYGQINFSPKGWSFWLWRQKTNMTHKFSLQFLLHLHSYSLWWPSMTWRYPKYYWFNLTWVQEDARSLATSSIFTILQVCTCKMITAWVSTFTLLRGDTLYVWDYEHVMYTLWSGLDIKLLLLDVTYDICINLDTFTEVDASTIIMHHALYLWPEKFEPQKVER